MFHFNMAIYSYENIPPNREIKQQNGVYSISH